MPCLVLSRRKPVSTLSELLPRLPVLIQTRIDQHAFDAHASRTYAGFSRRQRKAIEAVYGDYYDALAEDEVAEQSAWGAFAETQLAEEGQ